MLLRNSKYRGTASFAALIERARAFAGKDPEGYRGEFIRLADRASELYQLRDPEREVS
jgi:Ca-activated chloride channel family protein